MEQEKQRNKIERKERKSAREKLSSSKMSWRAPRHAQQSRKFDCRALDGMRMVEHLRARIPVKMPSHMEYTRSAGYPGGYRQEYEASDLRETAKIPVLFVTLS